MSGAGLPASCGRRRRSSTSAYTARTATTSTPVSYPDDDLRWWADRIGEWEGQGREVYAYFNNDGEGNAVRNAAALRHFLGA